MERNTVQAHEYANLIGRRFRSVDRTITEEEFSAITELSWITQTPHTDREYMRASSAFGDKILPGPCVYAIVVGLTGTSGILRCLSDAGLVGVAMLEVLGLTFESPVFPGDTLHVDCEISGIRPTPNRSGPMLVEFVERAANKRGQSILNARRTILTKIHGTDLGS